LALTLLKCLHLYPWLFPSGNFIGAVVIPETCCNRKKRREVMKRAIPFSIIVLIVWLFNLSVVHGITWTKNRRLTYTAGSSGQCAIAVDGPNIYVVWADTTLGKEQIYFKRSHDAGATWEATKRLTYNSGWNRQPALAVEGSNIYVAWTHVTTDGYHFDIFFKRSDDRGDTWTDRERLTSNSRGSRKPVLAVDRSNIYVVYINSSGVLCFKRSPDAGATWETSKMLTIAPGYCAIDSDLDVDGSNIYVVWAYSSTGKIEIYFKRSSDGGDTWTDEKKLTDGASQAWLPALAVEGQNIYVVWSNEVPENLVHWRYNEIWFKRSEDGGDTWSTKKLLSNVSGHVFPDMAVKGSNIFVVWADNGIYLKPSNDGGTSWSSKKRLSNDFGSPVIEVNGSNIYMVWSARPKEDEKSEIYFRKGVLD
jgi:hypothetical protein